LLANRSSTAGGRPDEREVVRGDHLGEALVLRQESVARVDRVAAGDERSGDDGGADRYERRASAGPMQMALVSELDGQRLAVGLAVGHHGLGAERPARAKDPQRDLAHGSR
jgi:hypothetical protein